MKRKSLCLLEGEPVNPPTRSAVVALCKLQHEPKSQEVTISNSHSQVLNYSLVTIEKYSQMQFKFEGWTKKETLDHSTHSKEEGPSSVLLKHIQ